MLDFLTPSFLNSVGTGLDVFGRVLGGMGDLSQGKQARQAAEFEAAQLRQNAGQAQAGAQREAFTAEQQTKMIASRALAAAAASGGGASDPTVVNLIAGIAGEGAYRQAVALYQGDEQARRLNMHADAAIYNGEMAEAAGKRNAFGKFVGAATSGINGIAKGQSLLKKYGGDGPTTTTMSGGGIPLGTVG